MKGNSESSEKVIGGVTTRIDESGSLVPGVANASFIDQDIANSSVQSVFKKTITDEAGHVMGTTHEPRLGGTLGSLEKGLNRVNSQDVMNMIMSGFNKSTTSTPVE